MHYLIQSSKESLLSGSSKLSADPENVFKFFLAARSSGLLWSEDGKLFGCLAIRAFPMASPVDFGHPTFPPGVGGRTLGLLGYNFCVLMCWRVIVHRARVTRRRNITLWSPTTLASRWRDRKKVVCISCLERWPLIRSTYWEYLSHVR